MIRQINKITAGLQRRLRLLISRGVVNMANDSLRTQNLQVTMLADETADDVERFQNYGHSSVPPVGSEAIVLSVGGIRQHLVAIAVDDKNSRLGNLEPGDSAVYHLEGHRIVLTKDGVIKIACKRLEVVAEDEILFDSPQTRFTGDVDIVGISQASDHLSGGISGANHIHPEHDGYSSGGPKA
ncbi:phage baseplate assembly protein V [Erwinia tracheiphila]|uniref:Phage baseplate assembly protein V n=1 Tax=Erwinia tracheiphila TaxID=65700 RepID=A0A0M2KKD8_9GAMM|nr:phage baseplate assembly protein V [Erwinia tracheiphila]AXF74872.1 phage baseplate assembly protein V [Erwinia tracheiphila]AXF76854.1 phage baseplate assembly protein V [Erwinia tracheiphila]EOS94148.1 Mu-like prophage FluMu protein [Erwinia tracheiphila PSU-1]KKF35708.1 phage baseplate protein [Erwinia tracheiphila]KKF36644.1 phage baseplate protein [Erwinia tracheiphila]